MQRDMSSHLDASFSTRGAGQLVNEQVIAMREVRAGNMKPAPHGLSRDGRYTIRPMQSGGGMGRRMPRGSAFARARAPGLAGGEMLPGMGIAIPGLGTIDWATLAVGTGVGLLLGVVVTKRRRKTAG